jgi:hypothetical protein
MPRTIRVGERKTFAATRDFGIEIRTMVHEALKDGPLVIVDLAGVEDMTPSFADECFGKLSEAAGEDITRSKVQIMNGDTFASLIAGVVRVRLQHRPARKSAGK